MNNLDILFELMKQKSAANAMEDQMPMPEFKGDASSIPKMNLPAPYREFSESQLKDAITNLPYVPKTEEEKMEMLRRFYGEDMPQSGSSRNIKMMPLGIMDFLK